jgi:lipopolysaccharide transport system ATP-binding protein
MHADVAIKVEKASKKYCMSLKRSMTYGILDITRNALGLSSRPQVLREDEFWAVDEVSFEVRRGETLGIIGHNGSGKTTLLKMLNGIFWPDRGKISVRGKVGALIGVGAGFHPLLTGRENIYLNAAILGMSRTEVDRNFDAIVAFADIGDFLDVPVKYYSSGMFVRLGFAVASHCEPDVLLIDEILAVGDASFRARCYDIIYSKLQSTATIFVSHDMSQVNRICDSVMLLDRGKARHFASTSAGIAAYFDTLCEEGAMLHGNGQASLADLRVLGPQGPDSLAMGRPLEIVFRLRVALGISDISVILSTLALDRLPVAFASFTTSLSEGGAERVIRFRSPRLTLAPGKYSLSIAVFDETRCTQILWHYNVCPFKVHGEAEHVVPVVLLGDWQAENPS